MMDSKGDFEKGKGSLYRLDDRGCTKLCDKINVSNGLAWDLKEKAFYYVDSLENNIRRYDYDVETGNICMLSLFYISIFIIFGLLFIR